MVVDRGGDGGDVVIRDIRESRDERFEAHVVFRLRGRGERGVGAAVKAVFHRDDFVTPASMSRPAASLIAASLASAPLLQKKHWPPKARSDKACANAPCASIYQVFGTWIS